MNIRTAVVQSALDLVESQKSSITRRTMQVISEKERYVKDCRSIRIVSGYVRSAWMISGANGRYIQEDLVLPLQIFTNQRTANGYRKKQRGMRNDNGRSNQTTGHHVEDAHISL